MSAIPGWYEDPTQTHERRYWDGAVWTDDVSDPDVGTRPSLPAAVVSAAPPSDGMHIAVWIGLALLGLAFLAVVATADSHRMHVWFEGGVFIAAIVLAAFLILVAGLLMRDHRPRVR